MLPYLIKSTQHQRKAHLARTKSGKVAEVREATVHTKGAKPEEKPVKKQRQYVDTGEKIGGAKKDLWMRIIRGKERLTEKEYDQMDEGTRMQAVNLNNLTLGILDDMRAKGAEAGTLKLAKYFLSTLPKKPGDSFSERSAYVRMISHVSHLMTQSKTPDDLYDMAKMIGGHFFLYSTYFATPEEVKEAHKIETRIREIAAAGPDAKDYTARHKYFGEHAEYKKLRSRQGELSTEWSRRNNGIARKTLGDRFYKMLTWSSNPSAKTWYTKFREALKMKPDDYDALTAEGEAKQRAVQKVESDKKKEPWKRIVPEEVERKGGVKKSFTSEEFRKTFGFRGVEYGNYVDEKSAQHHTQMCGAAFLDLSDMIGIPVKDVSWGGRLAMAFGARGTGNALAHYEPSKVVINLTKSKGGGSLSHEWFHFVDNMIARIASDNPSGPTGGFMLNAASGSVSSLRATRIPPAVQVAAKELYEAMFKGDHYEYYSHGQSSASSWPAIDRALSKYRDDGQAAMDALQAQYPGLLTGKSQKQLHNVADYIFTKTGEKVGYGRRMSKFYIDSISGGNEKYWGNPIEMGARAFEAFVETKMTAAKRKNTYLTAGVSGKGLDDSGPFPRGAEREKTNAAFEKLFAAFKQENVFKKAREIAVGGRCMMLKKRVAE